jgi:arylsulfatase A-like enzyme
VLITGCWNTPDHTEALQTYHLIQDTNLRLFERDRLMDQEEGPTWGEGDQVWIERYQDPASAAENFQVKDLPFHTQTHNEGISLRLETGLVAGDYSHFIVTGGMSQGWVELCWRRDGRRFPSDRPVTASARDDSGIRKNRFDFDLANHAEWHGQIDEIELTFKALKNSTARLSIEKLALVRRLITEEAVARAAARQWFVNIQEDLRPSKLARIGEAVTINAALPPGAIQLRFSVGSLSNLISSGTIHVDIELNGTNRRMIEFEREANSGGWQDISVDLPDMPEVSTDCIMTFRYDSSELAGVDSLVAWGSPRIIATAATRQYRPNIVLISLDTLRADHMSLHGYSRPTTPFLETFAAENAVVFENAVTQAPWTLPSHASLFTGLNAFRHGTNHENGVASDHQLLAEILRESGYNTLAITAGGYLHPRYGFAQGFDTYRWQSRSDPRQELESGVDAVLELIYSQEASPFFLFFHTYEIHPPFFPRAPHAEAFLGRPLPANLKSATTKSDRPGPEVGFRGQRSMYLVFEDDLGTSEEKVDGDQADIPIALYDSGIAYADEQIQRLFQGLEDRGLLQESLVVVTSDHGEALGEHGLSGHPLLYDDNLMVPLVIAYPDRSYAGRRVQEQVRLIDVLPTLLETLKIVQPTAIDGRSLTEIFHSSESRLRPADAWSYAASNNYGLALRRDNRIKMIYNDSAWQPSAGNAEMYDLEADPGEIENIIDSSTRSEELIDLAKQTLDRDLAGIHLRVENLSPGPLVLRLVGRPIAPGTLKSTHLSGTEVHWRGREKAELSLDTGGSAELFAIDFGPYPADLSFRIPNRPRFATLDLELHEIHSAMTWILSPLGTWSQDEDPDSGDTARISVSWRYREVFDRGDSGSSVVDTDLLRQLRALGYEGE